MQRFNGSLFRQFASSVTGNAATGVQVYVYDSGTTNLAQLYQNDDVSGPTVANPLTVNDIGFYAFYAQDGKYTLHFSSANFPDLEMSLLDIGGITNGFIFTGSWLVLPAVYKLILRGTGTATILTRDTSGSSLPSVTYQVNGTSEVFPFFQNAYDISATYTGTASAEVI